MLTPEKAQEVKNKYLAMTPPVKVFRAEHNGRTFILRPLTRPMHLAIQKEVVGDAPQPDQALTPEQVTALETKTVLAAVVWPEGEEAQAALEAEAGTMPAVFQQVMAISAFVAPQQPEEL